MLVMRCAGPPRRQAAPRTSSPHEDDLRDRGLRTVAHRDTQVERARGRWLTPSPVMAIIARFERAHHRALFGVTRPNTSWFSIVPTNASEVRSGRSCVHEARRRRRPAAAASAHRRFTWIVARDDAHVHVLGPK